MVKSEPDVRTQITRTLRRTRGVLLVGGILFGFAWFALPFFAALKELEPTAREHERMRSNYAEFVVGDLSSVLCRYTHIDEPLDIFTYRSAAKHAAFRDSLRYRLSEAGWKEKRPIGDSLVFEREDLDYHLIARVLKLPNGSVVVGVRSTSAYEEWFQRNWVRVVAAEGGSQFSEVK